MKVTLDKDEAKEFFAKNLTVFPGYEIYEVDWTNYGTQVTIVLKEKEVVKIDDSGISPDDFR